VHSTTTYEIPPVYASNTVIKLTVLALRSHLEFYLSAANIANDAHLTKFMSQNYDYFTLNKFMTFPRIRELFACIILSDRAKIKLLALACVISPKIIITEDCAKVVT